MTLLFHLLQQLVALLQNMLLRFGLEFVEKKGQRHQPSNSISVRSKQKNNGLNPGAPTSLAPRVGRLQGRRLPGRPDGCRKASRRALQGETDRPMHQQFRQ